MVGIVVAAEVADEFVAAAFEIAAADIGSQVDVFVVVSHEAGSSIAGIAVVIDFVVLYGSAVAVIETADVVVLLIVLLVVAEFDWKPAVA